MTNPAVKVRRIALALAFVIVLLVSTLIATGAWVVVRTNANRDRSDQKNCQSINEGRAGSRTAIGVVRDLVNSTGGGGGSAHLEAQPGAEPAVVQLVADLNAILDAFGTSGQQFRVEANAAIDKAIRNLHPVICE